MAQFVYLVHHADAVPPGVDHMRPLSTRGQAQAAGVAAAAHAHGARPALIWHSGKLRARQTAEACLRVLNPLAQFSAVRGLQPDDDPATIVAALEAEACDVLIASHMPLLPALLHRLTSRATHSNSGQAGSRQAGRRDRGPAEFPLNGCVALQKDGDVWVEQWRVTP